MTVNFNSSDLIARLITSLIGQTRTDYQLVIVNNSPGDQQVSQLKSSNVAILEAPENLGFGRACNLGLDWIYQQNNQAIVWLINPDAYFDSGFNSDSFKPALSSKSEPIKSECAVSQAISFFEKYSQISILGTCVYSPEGQLTDAGGTFTPGSAALTVVATLPADLTQDYWATEWVSGCSLLINLHNFFQCPQFDPRYFLYYEDSDFCLRYGQQGHEIAVTNLLSVIHNISSITDRNPKQKYRHSTQSYLIHIEKYGNFFTFVSINLRILINTVRLLIFRPQQGLGKLVGLVEYWQKRLKRLFD